MATDGMSSSPERGDTPEFTVAVVAVSALLAVLFARRRD
jgi:MYXO-CTERM domain-containing protein